MKRTMMAACILSLVACGGSKDDVATEQQRDWESRVQSLVYSFPDNAQQEVPTSSPVVLRFSSPVRTGNAALHDKIVLRDSNNSKIEWADIEEVDNGQSLLLHPQQKLSPLTTYHLSIAPIALQKGETQARNLTFSTRAAYEGPKSLVADDEFAVLRTLPNDLTYGPANTPVDVMEFTTFRVQFSQPLDRSTVKYGDAGNATVQLTGPDGLVDAHVLVSGPYLTIDPKEDLQPGVPHRITFTTGLKSIYGDSLPGGSFGNENDTIAQKHIDFTPKATGPRGNMVQDIADTLGKVSPLTGRQINEVPMASVLLGEDTATQASGIVAAELAFVPDFPDATPLRVKRGSLIEGASIDVLIGGEVPAGFESGKVRMDFLSDATGYLLPNPYSDTDDAPRQVRLWMDVAVSTETPQANGAITQDLLHIELVGTSLVDPDTKLMTINAVGVVEPNVLGSERATGLLSFYMEEWPDQDNPPEVTDTTPLELQSWTFGTDSATGLDKTVMLKPTDPIILNFNKALDQRSVLGRVRLYKNEGDAQIEIGINVSVDGSALVVKPQEPLRNPTETATVLFYRLSVDSGITDLSGKAWSEVFDETFELTTLVEKQERIQKVALNFIHTGEFSDGQEKSAFILGVYPGFPCPLNTDTRDLRNGRAGRCVGGMQPNTATDNILGEDGLGNLAPLPADDILPVPSMPANRPIVVVFSEAIDPASLFNDQGEAITFQVYEIEADEPDSVRIPVPGTVTLEHDTLRFTPRENWKKGAFYSYTIYSNGDVTSSAAQCNANQSGATLCGLDGLPVQTQMLAEVSTHDKGRAGVVSVGIFSDYYIWAERAPDFLGGGPHLTQYFVGADPSSAILQLMHLTQKVDSNNNLVNESSPTWFGPFGELFNGSDTSTTYAAWADYARDETDNVSWEPDSSSSSLVDPLRGLPMDPNGVAPPPNSAKILSSLYGFSALEQFPPNFRNNTAGNNSGHYAGANVGCGWDSFELMDDQTGCASIGQFVNVGGQFGQYCFQGKPSECPKDKFTYLHGVLFAEVTSEVVQSPNGQPALKVNIFPGHMITTSFRIYMKHTVGQSSGVSDSGFQVMRMRYPAGDDVITGYIEQGSDGPSLSTEVSLYLDAPFLVEDVTKRKRIVSDMHHNFYSYPVKLALAGGIRFLKDGRMVIEQRNKNAVEFNLRANSPRMMIDLLVPKDGVFIQYVSEPIK